MTPTPSSDQDIPPLDLKGNGDEYKRFIKSIIKERLYIFDPSIPATNTTQTPDQKEASKPNQKKAPKRTQEDVYRELAGLLKTNPLARTPFIKELVYVVEKWYFIVKLKLEKVELDILIRRVDLYLVGYKDNADKWILLKGESYFQKNQVDEWFKVAGKVSVETTLSDLGDSYYDLFSACRPEFKASINDEVEAALKASFRKKIEEKILKLSDCLKTKRSFEKKLQDALMNKVDTQAKIKTQDEEISKLKKDLILLIRVEEKLLKYESSTNMVKELKNEKKNAELCMELEKAGFGEEIEEKVLELAGWITKKRLSEKNLLDPSINQDSTKGKIKTQKLEISILEKELISLKKEKKNAEGDAEWFFELKKQEELVEKEQKMLSHDIRWKWVRKETRELDLNREALIAAVNDLKYKPFNKEKSAEHVLTLALMISEAVRFRKISNHIIEKYCDRVTLTEKMAFLIHKWTKGSHVITSLGKEPPISLGEQKYTIFEFLPYFSCLRGTRVSLRWIRRASTSMSANGEDDTKNEDGGKSNEEFIRQLEM